jgi:hypothetical protein
MAKRNASISTNGLSIPDWKLIRPDITPFKNTHGVTFDYNRLKNDALFFCHYEVSDKLIVAEYHKYCQKHFDKNDAVLMKRLPDYTFTVPGKLAYLLAKGGVIEETDHEVLRRYWDENLEKARALAAEADEEKTAEENKPKAKVISIQERMLDQCIAIMGEWEGLLDELVDGTYDIKAFDPHRQLQLYNVDIKPAHAKIIRDAYAMNYEEALEIMAWTDEDLREGFANLDTPTKRKQYLMFFEKIITACDTIINTGKATRKTRIKKAPSKEKLIAKLKYKESDPSIGIASVNPISIVGADTLWVYNVKNRKLGIYHADAMLGGLTVKGSAVVGFDASSSTQKTIRKPEQLLKGMDRLSKTKFQKLYEGVNATETKLNGRINEHTILVKVF